MSGKDWRLIEDAIYRGHGSFDGSGKRRLDPAQEPAIAALKRLRAAAKARGEDDGSCKCGESWCPDRSEP